ncbi:unnamed protein product [Fusarium langsethiae]|nr:unnamed protein product [Fusarium langsethiae]
MAIKTLGAKAAAALDQELMSTGAFSLDQLMELAGLAVSQAGKLLNNTAMSYMRLRGFCIISPCITWSTTGFYDVQSTDATSRLVKQLEDLEVPFVDDFPSALNSTDHVVDAIFGFSFSGEVREPFPAVIQALQDTKLPVTAVDAPSSWDIEDGPPKSGLGSSFMLTALISLTAPKPLVKHFRGRHFIGGRFVTPSIAKKFDFEVAEYRGIDQVVELEVSEQKL